MVEILGTFSNRELALASWLCLIILFVIFSFGRSQTVKDLVNSFFNKYVLLILAITFLYSLSTLGVLVFFNRSLLVISTLKLFAIWYLFSAFPSIFTFQDVKRKSNEFVNSSVQKIIAFTLIIDFIGELSVFSYWIEVLLIGFVTFLTFVLNTSFENERDGYKQLQKIAKTIVSIIASIMVINFISQIIRAYSNQTLTPIIYDFLITIYLSILFIPAIIILSKYSRIERVYTSVQNQMAGGEKFTILNFLNIFSTLSFNVTSLERWRDLVVSYSSKISIRTLYAKVNELLQTLKREKLNINVPFEKGWSSEKARTFLNPIISEMGFYKEIGEGDWFAASDYVTVKSETYLENDIAYYIEGNSDLVNQLKIVGNMNCKLEEEGFLSLFNKSASKLFEEAFKCPVSTEIIEKLNTLNTFNASFKGKNISLAKETWLNDHNRYFLKLTIQSPPHPSPQKPLPKPESAIT